MQLDERTRKRIAALANDSREPLDPAANARIASEVARSGPGLVRRARIRRHVLSASTACAALGLVAWVAASGVPGFSEDTSREPAALVPVAAKPAATEAPSPAAVSRVIERACSARSAISPHAEHDSRGSTRFDLAALGMLSVASASQVWVDAHDPCRTRVHLLEGRVAVHAEDLGGGELRVATDLGDVVVHGTVFAVERTGESLFVEVDEGRVSVERRGGEASFVNAGQRWMLVGAGPASPARIEDLPSSARSALREALQLESTSTADTRDAGPSMSPRAAAARARRDTLSERAPVQAERWMAEADDLWRRGDLAAARQRYRQAGASPTATGESAWLALARRELSRGDASAARAALREHDARFVPAALEGEALGIAFRIALAERDAVRAERIAKELASKYAGSAQGAAAERWLREHH